MAPANAKGLPRLPLPPADGSPTTLPVPAPEDDGGIEIDIAMEKAPSEPPTHALRAARVPLSAICMFGRFEILGRIAFGGMAEIFLGRESTSVGASRLLVIKRILPHVADDPKFVEMFLDEARLAIQLSHTNICHIYEFGDLEGSYFIAMEWIPGAVLGKILRRARREKGLAVELAAKIIAEVAEALHHAHTARDANGTPMQIVHRDVSPHNVMVSYDGHVKLLDFGIAKAQTASSKTEAGVVKGKFAYMSPQQCLGKNIDARADVFALGICLWEALAGTSLYQRDTDYETMKSVIEDDAPSLRALRSEVPEALEAIVVKALQKSPDARWRSAAEMQIALEDWLASTGKAVTTSRLALMMESLFAEEIRRGPLVDSTPFGASFHRQLTGSASGERSVPTGMAARPSSPPTTASGPRARNAAITGSQPAADAASLDEPGDAMPTSGPSRGRVLALGALVLLLVAGGVAFGASIGGGGETPEHAISPPVAPPVVTAPLAVPTPPVEPPVAPPPVVVVAPGTAIVLVDVDTAMVRIGDREVTAADAEAGIEIAPGHYDVHAEAEGHRSFDGALDVESGAEARLTVSLPARRVVVPGRLSINTRPWSKVYVGPRLLGTTPIGEASVPSGSVRLRIVDRDGRTFSRTVTVHAGATESVFYDLDH